MQSDNQTIKTLIKSLLALTILTAACNTNTEKVTLRNQQDTLSWAMGMSLAQSARTGFYQFDEAVMRQAFENTLNNGRQPIDQNTYEAACDYIGFLVAKYNREQATSAATRADSLQQQSFARLLADKPGLQKAPEGYYYEVLRDGKGPKAQKGRRIKFDFKGTNMLTGELIEQTYGVRDPIVHVLEQPMFEGLLQGMQQMNAGSIYRFYFPYQLVAGANGIPPYTPVIYEVELHEIFEN
jgi:FKBP-type peptidyl-prolyl cis-trans isomerase